jgi:ABC-type glycerol-3-phosphate transport system substrate-binding protein
MRKIKWVAAIATAVSVALIMSGCAASPQTSGKQQVVIWDTGLLAKTNANGSAQTSKSFLNQAAANYEKTHKNISIKVVEQGGDISATNAQFKAASIAGNGPDIHIQYTGGPTLTYAKYFENLAPVLGSKTLKQFKGLNTAQADYSTNGSQLALPYGSGTYFTIWWNKKLLRQAGMNADQTPKTWQALLAEATTYKAKTNKPAFYVANLEGYVGAWVVAALAAGQLGPQAFTDQYTGKTKITSSAMVNAYNAWQELYKSGLVNPDAGQVGNSDGASGFLQGKAPFYISGGWEDGILSQGLGSDLGWEFIPVLKGAKFPDAATGGPQIAISVTKYAQHKSAAEDFVKYLAEPAVQDLYVKLNQTEGSSDTAGNSSVISNPILKAQINALKNATVTYPFDNVMPQEVIDLYYRLNASTFLGTTTPKDAVQQLQSALKQAKQ